MKQYYLSYTDQMGFAELEGRADYDFMLKAAQIMKRLYYQIHSDSTKKLIPSLTSLSSQMMQ